MNNNNGEHYDILLTRFLKDVIINFKRFNYVINIFKRNNFMNPVIGFVFLQIKYIYCAKKTKLCLIPCYFMAMMLLLFLKDVISNYKILKSDVINSFKRFKYRNAVIRKFFFKLLFSSKLI